MSLRDEPRGRPSVHDGLAFTGRTALVAGASSGIGAEIALLLARLGVAVGLVSRGRDRLEAVAAAVAEAGGTAVVAPADVSDTDALAGAVHAVEQALGPIDMLVNSVGYGIRQVFLREQDETDWLRTIDVNLNGTFRLCRLVVPGMMDRGRGSVVLLSSLAGKRGFPANTAYCAAKFGINGFMQSLASETGRYGVRVNSICPGITESESLYNEQLYGGDFMDSLRHHHGPPDLTWTRYIERAARSSALGRLVQPVEVARLAAFLLSDLAEGITGQAVSIDGGM